MQTENEMEVRKDSEAGLQEVPNVRYFSANNNKLLISVLDNSVHCIVRFI